MTSDRHSSEHLKMLKQLSCENHVMVSTSTRKTDHMHQPVRTLREPGQLDICEHLEREQTHAPELTFHSEN